MNPSPPAGARSDEPVTHEEVWLLGQPPLGDYLGFVKDRAIGGAQAVQARRERSRRYVFRSESMDLRYHGTTLFRPDQIADHEAFGPMAGIVGVVVGFGSNFLNVIRADHRMVLHNGYHRACALLALGI